MKLMYAKESQLATSSRLVSMVSTMESSDKRSRRICVNPFKISCSVMLLGPPCDVRGVRYIVGQLQYPPCRAGSHSFATERKAECAIQLADDPVLRSWNVVGAKGAYAHAAHGLDSDIHRFMLQLPAEYTAAHHPGIDFKQVGDLRVWTQNHRTDQAIVAESVDEPEFQGETSIGGGEARDIFKGMTSGRRIKLIRLSDQLCDTCQIDGLEGSEDHRHLESPQKVVHALRRLKKGVAPSVG